MILRINTKPCYDVVLKRGLINNLCALLDDIKFDKVAVITDDTVASLYLENVKKSLGSNRQVFSYVFGHGEENKNLKTVEKIYEFLCEYGLTRTDLIVALGGGVVGDTVGFAAATFLRGTPYVQIPTTLLSMIDSSIGGKTGINLKGGKNLAGSFYQPSKVLIDTEVLNTLDEQEWQNGIGEMIKYGAIKDRTLFNKLSKGNLKEEIDSLILRCLKIKKYVVEKDTLDKGIRQILNFGHTLGHAIEKHSEYKISHGKAIGIGMALIAQWSEERCLAKTGTALNIKNLLKRYDLPYEYDLSLDKLWEYAINDKKKKGGKISLAIVPEIGKSDLFEIKAKNFLSERVNITVKPSPISGKIIAPPSKSMAHRALFCALLSKKPTKITNIELSKDIFATLNVLKALGKDIEFGDNFVVVKEGLKPKNVEIDCIESGTTFRFLIPVLAALGVEATIHGQGRLGQRPYEPLTRLLEQKGALYDRHEGLPLKAVGKITHGDFYIRGDISSQYISGLLLALPLLRGNSRIILTSPLESSPYVDMSLRCMREFGVMAEKTEYGFFVKGNQKYEKKTFNVEGDFSAAAFMLCLGALCGDTEVTGLDHNSLQGDKQIVDILKKMGADIQKTNGGYKVNKSVLHGVEVDAKNIPDLVPILSVVMSFANGTSVIKNTKRLCLKESDRQKAVLDIVSFLGKSIKLLGEDIIIEGGQGSKGGEIEGRADHRIIMSLAVAALRGHETCILGSQYVKKSYPNFFLDIKSLGGEYVVDLG
ncbi:MAG: 3-phosphoshikimate 1-carboxyvinyltransferase [Bacillota bacterium]|jgi:3-phosphoshikimate 1-carboxyvinyltransferase|nr:3-phosphoshikimate 1-carboxyvinyltransferase [Bacillota bacterium]HHU42982.1 3-phosphoshikimate 1-carboxyvinyltransferase [Clostridiales bacterium]